MPNTFNEDFQRALASKLALQASQTAENSAQAAAIPINTSAEARQREALARGADIQGNLAISEFQKALGQKRDFNVYGNDFTSPGAFSFLAPGANSDGGASTFETAFSNPSSTQLYKRGNSYSNNPTYGDPYTQQYYADGGVVADTPLYADGGVVADTNNPLLPDYELYRKAASAIGLPDLPAAAVIPQIAQLRAQARQQLFQQLARGGTTPGFAGGGAVEFDGPGTGKSDSIPALVDGSRPAAVSDGELRIPKRIVDYYGVKFFDALKMKAQQASRRAGMQNA
jgi:hypothetical protein